MILCKESSWLRIDLVSAKDVRIDVKHAYGLTACEQWRMHNANKVLMMEGG